MAFASQNHFGIFDVNSLSSKVQRARQLKMKHSIDEFLFYYYLFFSSFKQITVLVFVVVTNLQQIMFFFVIFCWFCFRLAQLAAVLFFSFFLLNFLSVNLYSFCFV